MVPNAPDLTLEETGGWLWSRMREAFPESVATLLMPNHPHLLPLVDDPEAAAQRLARLLGQFGRRFGIRGQASLVADPKPMHDAQKLAREVRYIALNPCRAKLVRCPLAWPWSTHRDVIGAIADPWTTADALADALRFPRDGFARRHHAYVSGDPDASVTGTPFPRTSATSDVPMIPLPRIARAVAAALREPLAALRRPGRARAVFVALAHDQGWRAPAPLAALCHCVPQTIRNVALDLDVAALAAARLCLADDRLRRLPPSTAPAGR